MRRNQLQELLQEDQEPFHLQDYIDDRRQRLHSRRPNHTSSTRSGSNFTTKLCKKACFFSSSSSPDVVESPVVVKTTKNVIFFHVPAKTAAMLLEASARIRQPKKLDASKRLGSFLKKLKQSSADKRKKSEEEDAGIPIPLRNILRYDSSTTFIGRTITLRQNPTFSPETPEIKIDQNLDFETEFCSSPFHFVLHNDSYNHNHQPPNSSSSSADSPSSAETETGEQYDKDLVKQCRNEVEKTEDDEEHCSPVSVLDPDPYEEQQQEEDINERHEEEDDEDESGSFDMDRSYAYVQRARERLLEKLSRFERLAELDPLELEIRFQEHEQDDDFSDGFDLSEEEVSRKETNSSSSSSKKSVLSYIDRLVKEVLNRPEFATLKRVPAELKHVTKIIITEEELKLIAFDDKMILLERVVRRLASWEEVLAGDVCNTIVGFDINCDIDERARKQEQVTVAAMDIEIAIFEELVEELCVDLVLYS